MNLLCTVCSGVLEATEYEGTPVHHCNQCKGYLLERQGVDDIKETPDKTTAELAAEQDRERVGDTLDTIRCPRCGAGMGKEFLTEPDAFHVDYCNACSVLWFDGGELARLQLTYESRRRGRDRERPASGWRSRPASAGRTSDAAEPQYEEAPEEQGEEEEGGMFSSFSNFVGKLFGKTGRGYRRRRWMTGEDGINLPPSKFEND